MFLGRSKFSAFSLSGNKKLFLHQRFSEVLSFCSLCVIIFIRPELFPSMLQCSSLLCLWSQRDGHISPGLLNNGWSSGVRAPDQYAEQSHQWCHAEAAGFWRGPVRSAQVPPRRPATAPVCRRFFCLFTSGFKDLQSPASSLP